MGLTDIMAQPVHMTGEVVGVVTAHVPSHSRESSTSSTASSAASNGLATTQELSSSMPIYSPLSKCSSPTANHSVCLLNHLHLLFCPLFDTME